MPQHGKQERKRRFYSRSEQRLQNTLLVVTAEGVELSRGSVLDPLVADAQRVHGHLAAAGIEKCRDGLADAPAQGTVLDRDHMAELGTDLGQQGFVERFDEAQVVMRHAHALLRGAFRGTGGSVADRPDRHQRHVRTFAEPPAPADGQRFEGTPRHRRPAPLPRG